MEWKDGQDWVILTAFRTGTKEPVTLEFTLWQWLRLIPVRYAVEERLERWQWRRCSGGRYEELICHSYRPPRARCLRRPFRQMTIGHLEQ
jgi:hypothetical protein